MLEIVIFHMKEVLILALHFLFNIWNIGFSPWYYTVRGTNGSYPDYKIPAKQ